MTTSFEFQPWEHFRALRAISRHWRGWVAYYFVMAGVPLALLSVIALGQIAGPEAVGLNLGHFWYLFLPPVLALVIVPGLQVWQAFNHQRETPAKRGLQERALGPEGLSIRSPSMSMDLKWTGMVQVVETDEFFLFYSTPRCGYYLPKRALPRGGVEKIRDLVTRHGPARRRLLTSAPAA